MTNDYYRQETPRLLKMFENYTMPTKSVLLKQFNENEVDSIISETKREFEELIPRIPYIGGRENRLSSNLEASATSLALYRVLSRYDLGIEEIGKINYDIVKTSLESASSLALRFFRWFRFSWIGRRYLKGLASRTQERQYPDDWVAVYIEGTGQDFDYGIDYTQCAICHFYKQEGAFEYAKYLCLIDFLTASIADSGLERTTTIAEGYTRCDFRWKKGRPVRPGWPPPFLQDEF
jgi:hypothetical protein